MAKVESFWMRIMDEKHIINITDREISLEKDSSFISCIFERSFYRLREGTPKFKYGSSI